jgi:hypothetical protein
MWCVYNFSYVLSRKHMRQFSSLVPFPFSVEGGSFYLIPPLPTHRTYKSFKKLNNIKFDRVCRKSYQYLEHKISTTRFISMYIFIWYTLDISDVFFIIGETCRRGERAYAIGWLKLGLNVHWWIRRREGAVETAHRTHC